MASPKLGLLVLLALVACGTNAPWQPHAQLAPKPGTQLRAPNDQALLVVMMKNAQSSGGAYAVFEREGIVAEFDETLAAWTVKALRPGLHQLYVHRARSCMRIDANVVEGKIYVLDLNPTDVAWESPGREDPARALAYLPYVALDAPERELANHAPEMRDCMQRADARAAKTSPHAAGYEEIDFTSR